VTHCRRVLVDPYYCCHDGTLDYYNCSFMSDIPWRGSWPRDITAQRPSTLASRPWTSDVHTMYVCWSIRHFTDWDQATLLTCWFHFRASTRSSARGDLDVTRTRLQDFGKRTSSVAGPAAWNNLTLRVPDIRVTDSVQESTQDSSLACCVLHD